MLLDITENCFELNDFFLNPDITFNPYSIKLATMYFFGKESSEASKFGIPDDDATKLYSQLEQFDRVEVGDALKDIECKVVKSITDYEPLFQKELAKALGELKTVETAYETRLREVTDY